MPLCSGPAKSRGITISDIRVTQIAVEKKLRELDASKAQGPDGIPAKVLKELCKEIALPFTHLFNKSLESGCIPQEWREAEVVAIFKKGTKSDPGNYRPVSLTCISCKVLESLIRDALVNYFNENKLYAESQHGFRNKRSCMTQLLQVMNDLTKIIDEGDTMDMVYLDFKKAFDSVPHKRLLLKLSGYGISGALLNWIKQFLSDRKQKVKIGESLSAAMPVLSGIPQGSILGPVLFTIFINDLPDGVQSSCKIFADDTKIYERSKNYDSIQDDLMYLAEWSEKWNLNFNVQKCKVLHFQYKKQVNPKHKYKMSEGSDTCYLGECSEEKDLGVTFDDKLTFDPHIHNCISKANQITGLIKRSFDFLEKEIFIQLYKALVRPHLEYGNLVWYPYLKRQSAAVERVQRRATKLIKACSNLSYKERLAFLNLPSLKARRYRGDLIETYKFFHMYDDTEFSSFFILNKINSTRNNEGKLFVLRSRTNLRKYSFANRVVTHWNALPKSIKFAPNLNKFKSLLDNWKIYKQIFTDYDDCH